MRNGLLASESATFVGNKKKVTENKTAVDTAARFNTCLLKIEGEKYGITAWEWENSFSSACVQQVCAKV